MTTDCTPDYEGIDGEPTPDPVRVAPPANRFLAEYPWYRAQYATQRAALADLCELYDRLAAVTGAW